MPMMVENREADSMPFDKNKAHGDTLGTRYGIRHSAGGTNFLKEVK
jgi:hypothetical protein